MMNGLIVLLTDFGYKDPYVGVMKGVIKSINPKAEIIDLTHMVRRQDTYEAAIVLLVSAKYFPEKTIFVCVVDPGVGSSRKALLIETSHYYLVGPDNGCLSLLAQNDGVKSVYDVSESKYRLRRVSYTFHGRDVFAPIAAWLSRGIKPEELGVRISFDDIVKYDLIKPEIIENTIHGSVIYIDVFGNIMTNISMDDINKIKLSYGEKLYIKIDDKELVCPFVPSFSYVGLGEPACYINSWDYFEIGVNHGNAAEKYGVKKGAKVSITREKLESKN
nr:S-adenosyl-l-methionine hydroxide adenosyltransferase family protein [Staphylothermus marinus]